MENIIIIAGPTASGKTKYAINLANQINAEIVSADSMQIYQYMNIGTAKPDLEEQQGIRHHMIDIIDPSQDFSVAQYQSMALACIQDILSRGKRVIIAGGTGLYINSLLYNITYADTTQNEEFRIRMTDLAAERGNEWLHAQLEAIDPQAAQNIHMNNTKRVIRALEIYEETGITATQQILDSKRNPSAYQFEVYGLLVERETLNQRINQRVDEMIKAGLVDEVRYLVDHGYHKKTAMQAIGYKEIVASLDGEISLEEAVEYIKLGTRQYAKRQMTWFRRIPELKWVSP